MPARQLITASFIVLASGAIPALGQQNTVYIEQIGLGNNLVVDQSAAENSQVRGLGKTNTLSLSLGVQSFDTEIPFAEAARQRGNDNSASITLTGADGEARLDQVSRPMSSGSTPGLSPVGGNSATMNIDGAGLAAIGQYGTGNTALLTTTGFGSQGLIVQRGNSNEGTLLVEGGASGALFQNGHRNDAGTVTVGGVGTSVTVIQNGNNLAPINGEGVSVISNAAAVTITQTSMGIGN